MVNLPPYQLLGFIEGDGYFSIQAKQPCISVAQHSDGESVLEVVEKHFIKIADQDIFMYKFDIPKLVRPFMQRSSSEDNESITLN